MTMSQSDSEKLNKFVECAVAEERITQGTATELHFFVKILGLVSVDWEIYVDKLTEGENNGL